jgi:two-component system sensor histidine kinase/response regulator
MALRDFTLLYVEDDALTRETVQSLLEDEVKTIYLAADGKEGLECYRKAHPDIVVTDIAMPVMDGLQMCREIKTLNSAQQIAVVSAFSDTKTLKSAIDLGINQYIFKPIEASSLFNTLESMAEALEAEIEHRKLQQMLLQQSKMAAMGELIGAIAHQWRQPLNAVGVLAQEIELKVQMDRTDKEEIHAITAELLEYLEYMSKTIDDFRDFLKPSGKKEPFDVVEALANALKIVGKQLENHGIALELERVNRADVDEASAYTVEGHENEFDQVLINIINNAREAIESRAEREPLPEKTIAVTLVREEKALKLTIRDNGGGISGEVLGTLFEPYVSTKQEQQGMGLGLYMSKLIIERNMHGTLTARNVPDGAEFQIRFVV